MSVLDKLRKAVHQQTAAIGMPVENLIGPVPAEVIPLTVVVDSAWLMLQVPGIRYLTPDDFYTRFATLDERVVREVRADSEGMVVVASPNAVTYLLRGAVDVLGTIQVPVGIYTGSGQDEWGFYVDGNLQRRGTGKLSFSLNLNAGRHIFEVVVASSSFGLFVQGLRIQPLRDVLAAPTWAAIDPGYMDPHTGTPAVKLSWYTDPKVGGWSVQRREVTDVAPIYQLTEVNTHGEFGVVVPGDHAGEVQIGATAYAGFERVGVILDAAYDPAGTVTFESVLYTGITSFRMQLPADRAFINDFWLGRTLGTGVFRELTRVQRVGLDPIVSYVDAAVVYGEPYEYALQSYGLFDPAALSPLSEIRYVRAGDVTPPGPIFINGRDAENPVPDDPAAPFPAVINYMATVLFDTPADEDYAGVRVYYRYVQQTGTPAAVDAFSLTLPVAAPTGDQTGYIIQIVSGTGAGQARRVESFTGNVVNLHENDGWLELPAGSTFELFKMVPIITDYGLPNTSDQFTFRVFMDPADPEVPLYGDYYFSSFDMAGNEQDVTDSVHWEYTEDDDTFIGDNQPPVVGIRQLGKLEQELNYRNLNGDPLYPSMNFSVVEMTAYDPVDEKVGVMLEYRTRKITTGISDGANSATTLNDADALGVDASGVPINSEGWIIDEHKNYIVEILNGTGEGQQRLIASNTATQLVLVEPWEVIPDETSEYQIAWIGGLPATLETTNIDDPRGTRSLFVVVTKTEGSNFLGVRAHDKEGLYSDELWYRPDFDNIPEVSSVEVRIDVGQNIVYVTGSVDDDTQSFKWWLENADSSQPHAPESGLTPGPNEEYSDTSIEKAFPLPDQGKTFQFILLDGERRTLVIRPYSGTNFTGVEGNDFRKEISRSPRTWYVDEAKTPDGDASAQSVKLTFFCTPKIPVVHGEPLDDGTPTAFIDQANPDDPNGPTITDTEANWSVDEHGIGQFASNPATYTEYVVRIINPTTKVEQFARITGNTSNTLQLATWFDPTYFEPHTNINGWPFEIRAGVTWWRYWKAGAPNAGEAAWIATYDPDFFERDRNAPVFVQFYSQLSGVPDEEWNTVIFDIDDLPAFTKLNVNSVNETGLVNVSIEGIDDDTKSWICFARKGRSPTIGAPNEGQDPPGGVPIGEDNVGPQKGDLDYAFRRFEGLVKTTTDFSMSVGPGQWYFTACPINSKGEYGGCHTRIVTIEVVNQVPRSLSSMVAAPGDQVPGTEGADAYNLIRWNHDSEIASPNTNVFLRMWGYRVDLGSATEKEVTASALNVRTGPNGGERLPWQDSMDVAGNRLYQDRTLDIDTLGGQGSFLHLTQDKRGTTTGARDYTWRYRAKLYEVQEGGLEPLEVWSSPVPVETTSRYQGDSLVPAFVPNSLVFRSTSTGACSTIKLQNGSYTAWPVRFLVQWKMDPTKLNGVDYSIRVVLTKHVGVSPQQNITVGTASPGLENGSFSWTEPQNLVATQRVWLANWRITDNLQFLTNPGGDGVGYQHFDLLGANAEITQVTGRFDGQSEFLIIPELRAVDGSRNWMLVNGSNGIRNGGIRIYNNLATTTRQAIEVTHTVDTWIEGVQEVRYGCQLALIKTSTGAQVALMGTSGFTMTVGACAADGKSTN